MTTQIVQVENALKDRSFIGQFTSQRFDSALTPATERRFAVELWRTRDELKNCTPESFQIALLDAAVAGLSLSPSKGHAYLIPYGNTVTFAPGYRGIVHLAYKCGILKDIQVDLAYENDKFRYWRDQDGVHFVHEPTSGRVRGEVTHAYCFARFMNGGEHLEVMTAQELTAVEKAATSRKKGGMVWRSGFRDQMQKKAVIRRGSKYWPMDDGGMLQHLQEIMDKHDAPDFSSQADSEGPEQEVCISLDQVTELRDILTDGGLTTDQANEWLKRYAKAKCGAGSIEGLPARLRDQAEWDLTERLGTWRENHYGKG